MSEEDDAHFLLRLFYCWVNPMLARGWTRNQAGDLLSQDDLLKLPRDEDGHGAYAPFKEVWGAEVRRFEEESKTNPNARPRLFRSLIFAYKRDMFLGGLMRLLADGGNFAAPFLLRELITWLAQTVYGPAANSWEGYSWALAIAANQFLISFLNNASLFFNAKCFSKMKSSIALAIFDKALLLDADHGMEGLAVQLHTTDASKFLEMAFFFHQVWSSPIIIVGALVALYFFVGWAGVLSIGAIVIFLPFQGIAMTQVAGKRREGSAIADTRMSAIGEMLVGIRIVKFMGWEVPLAKRVARIRAMELRLFRLVHFFRSIMTIVVTVQPSIVSFAVFAIAYALNDPIKPINVFPTIAMLNVLRMPMAMLPMAAAKCVDLAVSLDRIASFLIAPEKDAFDPEPCVLAENAIEMRDMTVVYKEKTRNEEHVVVNGVNLDLPKGKLTVVVGATGSGKTTLIAAMLGEAHMRAQSRIRRTGTVAYVPQEAWLMNATLRTNITLGAAFDEDRYVRTVNACQLIPDLQQLKSSDMTEIGERGINISGGQKQRVALARAVYSNCDVIVMDDPLSAVDSHVSAALFDQCICGVLSQKTRVLVTHQIQYLARADRIVLIGDGKVEFAGSYEELMASDIDLRSRLEETPTPQSPSAQHAEPAEDAGTALHDVLISEASPSELAQPQIGTAEDGALQPIPAAKEDKLMTVEDMVQGTIDGRSLRWYFGMQGVPLLAMVALFYLSWRAVSIVADLMVSWWSTRTPILGHTLSDRDYLLWYFVFIVAQVLALILRQVPLVAAFMRCSEQFHHTMISRLMYAPTSYFDTTPAGRILARFSKDVEMVDMVISESTNFCYNLICVVLGVLAVMCYSSYYLIILVFVLFIAYGLMFRYYTATNRAQKRLDSNNRSPMAALILQTLGGLTTIRTMGCGSAFAAEHLTAVDVLSRSTFSWRSTQRWLMLRVDIISMLMVLATSLVACGVLQSLSKGDQQDALPVMALAITYSLAVSGALGFLTTISAELESAFSSVERCFEFAHLIPQERTIRYGTGPDEHPPPPPKWPAHGGLMLDKVCLRYAEGKPLVLKDLSVNITAGHRVGIVGRTGSGKSTLMLALFRMVELESGSICIDGVDIAHLTMQDLRSKITIIPQDPMLFAGTIRSNLDPFKMSSDVEVWKVLRRVGMEDRVLRDGRGLDAVVGERGANFSVGQRQLLCLARALLKRCRILMLDEATASVDYDSDAMIQRTIRAEFRHCTVLTIAHRLSTIIDSDRVLVLDHGVLQEYDTPLALLQNARTTFYGMVQATGQEQFDVMIAAARAKSLEGS